MPPKQRFTKDIIIDAALNVLRRNGGGTVAARQIAAELGCSTQPVFSCYPNMDELNADLELKVHQLYDSYITRGLEQESAFKGVGMSYLAFARDEPQLFKLLFMDSGHRTFSTALEIDENRERILNSVIQAYGLDRQCAQVLYLETWIFTHGVAVMIATGTTDFSETDLNELLTDAFIGLLLRQKQKEGNK